MDDDDFAARLPARILDSGGDGEAATDQGSPWVIQVEIREI